jgi:hypothetical protein
MANVLNYHVFECKHEIQNVLSFSKRDSDFVIFKNFELKKYRFRINKTAAFIHCSFSIPRI